MNRNGKAESRKGGRTADEIFPIRENLESAASADRLRLQVVSPLIAGSSRIRTETTAISSLLERIRRRLAEGVIDSFAGRRSSLAVHSVWRSNIASFVPLA